MERPGSSASAAPAASYEATATEPKVGGAEWVNLANSAVGDRWVGENSSARADGCSRAAMGKRVGLLFTAVAVTAHELVDAAGGVDELLLAGEEGV